MRAHSLIAVLCLLLARCGEFQATLSGETKPVTVKGTGTGQIGAALPPDAIKRTPIEVGDAKQSKENLKSARLKEFYVQVEPNSVEKNLDYMSAIGLWLSKPSRGARS